MGFIGLGNCSKYYIYILISSLSYIFLESILGLNIKNKEKPGTLFKFVPKIREHKLIRNSIFFLGTIFGSIILFLIEWK